jgi:ABC-type branched-subunit amino acid transport system ATPase component
MTGAASTAILETRNLHVNFGGVAAVNGVDFRVVGREIRAVIGPNGAGKTTLFNALSGVVRPSSGKIIFEQQDITGLSPRHIARRRLVRTFQVTSLFSGLSVRDNIGVSAQASRGILKPIWRRDLRTAINEKTDEILELLDLCELSETVVADLSYGDQRLVEVAVALAREPKLLLLDEPTAGMSPHETDRIAQLVRRMRELVSIIIIEHDMEVVMGLADKISVLNFGRLVAEGSPTVIQNDPIVQEVYLGNAPC